MIANPYIRRLIGEGVEQEADAELNAPAETMPPADDPSEVQPDATADAASAGPDQTAPSTQELAQLWQRGERMGVAARLMFTEASYADFVDLVFIIGHEAGRELGGLLDELAETEGIAPPETPPQYSDLLSRVAGANEEEGVL